MIDELIPVKVLATHTSPMSARGWQNSWPCPTATAPSHPHHRLRRHDLLRPGRGHQGRRRRGGVRPELYAGAANASTKLAGEVIGILAGPNPAEVQSGLRAAVAFLQEGGGFRSANEDGSVVYFAHTVSARAPTCPGRRGWPRGRPWPTLSPPPLEAMVGLDEALKAADVELVTLYEPPSETNFGGGLLTGTQSACNAAAPPLRRQ